MRKVYDEYFDETYYEDTLDNGLKVIIIHKDGFLTTSCAFGTRFGALDIKQKYDGKEYNFNPGVAHFLEHKLFECEEKDIFAAFSNLGCNVNAFTSYNYTVYYFDTTNNKIKEPLNLLLNFVQDLAVTEENVEKEKGIINQELAMYNQRAESKMLNETYASLYDKFPLKYDVGGDFDSVNKITKDELELCYKLNYHPNNMILCITSSIDPKLLFDIVKENQNSKTFAENKKVETIFDDEKDEVVREYFSFDMDVAKPRDAYAIKLKPNFKDERDVYFKEKCMDLYLNSIFSAKNPNYQSWLDKKIINTSFEVIVDFSMSYAHIIFFCEDMKTDIKKFVQEALKDNVLNDEIIKETQRASIGSSFKTLDNIADLNIGYLCDRLTGHDFFEEYKIALNIKYDDVIKVFNSFDLKNEALIHINECGKWEKNKLKLGNFFLQNNATL